MDSLPVQHFRQFSRKGRLFHRFTAREGHAAAAAEEWPVRKDPGQDRLRRHFLPADPAGLRRARGNAQAAAPAAGRIQFPVQAARPGGTGGAYAAMDAPVLQHHHLRFMPLRFRVMAPPAAQRASLEENAGADSRPVIDGKRDDVGYDSAGHISTGHGKAYPPGCRCPGSQTAR